MIVNFKRIEWTDLIFITVSFAHLTLTEIHYLISFHALTDHKDFLSYQHHSQPAKLSVLLTVLQTEFFTNCNPSMHTHIYLLKNVINTLIFNINFISVISNNMKYKNPIFQFLQTNDILNNFIQQSSFLAFVF